MQFSIKEINIKKVESIAGYLIWSIKTWLTNSLVQIDFDKMKSNVKSR